MKKQETGIVAIVLEPDFLGVYWCEGDLSIGMVWVGALPPSVVSEPFSEWPTIRTEPPHPLRASSSGSFVEPCRL